MKKKQNATPPRSLVPEQLEKRFEEDKRAQESLEIEETQASKKLAAAMIRSARGGLDDTLLKAVDLLNNQNGKNTFDVPTGLFFFRTSNSVYR